MSDGYKIFDNAGNVVADGTTRFGRVLGSVVVGAGNQSGSVSNAAFAEGNGWAFLEGMDFEHHPTVSFSSSQMTWTASGSIAWNGTIRYGVF